MLKLFFFHCIPQGIIRKRCRVFHEFPSMKRLYFMPKNLNIPKILGIMGKNGERIEICFAEIVEEAAPILLYYATAADHLYI